MNTTPTAPITTTLTSAAQSLLDMAARTGFEVRHPFAAYRGTDEFTLEGFGRNGHYGVVTVGARSGRILRVAIVAHGTNKVVGRAVGAVKGRELLRSL